MKILTNLLLLIALAFCLEQSTYATEISGVVKSETGKPLAGVQILTYAALKGDNKPKLLGIELTMRRYEAATDQNGFFKIPDHGQIVFFKRQDLRPLTKVIDLSTKQIEIVMEDGARSTWKVPLCSSLADNRQRVGIGFKVAVPENVLSKKVIKFDQDVYYYGYDLGERYEVMANWWGASSIEPDDKFVLGSKDITERTWTSGKITGYEIRGVKADGKMWRRVSFSGGAIAYQKNSKESATAFDSLIDGMCFDESEIK